MLSRESVAGVIPPAHVLDFFAISIHCSCCFRASLVCPMRFQAAGPRARFRWRESYKRTVRASLFSPDRCAHIRETAFVPFSSYERGRRGKILQKEKTCTVPRTSCHYCKRSFYKIILPGTSQRSTEIFKSDA